MGYLVRFFQERAVFCTYFVVVRREGGAEMCVTRYSSSLKERVATVGAVWYQIMSRSSLGSAEKFVKVDMVMVYVVVFGKGIGSSVSSIESLDV
jgi:uncharacterized protein YodC (DUF2158 family)